MRWWTLALALVAGTGAGALFSARFLAARVRRLQSALTEATGEPEAGAASDPFDPVLRHLRSRLGEARAERQVRDQILSSMGEGVVLFDGEGSVLYANPAAERLLGSWPTSSHRLQPGSLREAVRRGEGVIEIEVGGRWLRCSSAPAGDAQTLLVLQDVTESKRIDTVRRDFVANASHELKTPAASIRAAAETLRTAAVEDPEVVPRFAEQLERDAVRLSRIVSDLLDLSRLETGSELTESVRLDLVAKEQSTRFESSAREAGLTLTVSARPVPEISGSQRDLSLLVSNLVDNAIRYSKPGGHVDVSVVHSGDVIVLRVTDGGVGIPSSDLPRIFERFYRVDRARSRETGGTGLGLSIVKHVVDNHGGTIEAESELGRGTSFTIRLPVAEGEGSPRAMLPQS